MAWIVNGLVSPCTIFVFVYWNRKNRSLPPTPNKCVIKFLRVWLGGIISCSIKFGFVRFPWLIVSSYYSLFVMFKFSRRFPFSLHLISTVICCPCSCVKIKICIGLRILNFGSLLIHRLSCILILIFFSLHVKYVRVLTDSILAFCFGP